MKHADYTNLLETALYSVGVRMIMSYTINDEMIVKATISDTEAKQNYQQLVKSECIFTDLRVIEFSENGSITDITEQFIDEAEGFMTWTLTEIKIKFSIAMSKQGLTNWCNKNLVAGSDYIIYNRNMRVYTQRGKDKILSKTKGEKNV